MQRARAALIGVVLWTAPIAAENFTEGLWRANEDVYHAILAHPFLRELEDGSLDREAFAFYMMQDAHYLREFAHALRVVADKAPKAEWAALLRRHADESIDEERRLHEEVFRAYGISEARVSGMEPAPEAFAYTSFLVATAYSRPFSEGIAALLPCYWIYLEVGEELADRGSRDPVYQRWIDNYSSPAYRESVEAVRAIVDEVASSASAGERERMAGHYRRGSRFEWMFWDSAYHQRAWPPVP